MLIADYISIPGFVMKKNSSRGPKHGQFERQIVFFKAKEMLKKIIQSKHGGNPTILARWYAQEGYREVIGGAQYWRKRNHALRSQPLLKDMILLATRAERLQNAKHWVLRLNADGPQKRLRQRQGFADAVKQCIRMQDAHMAEAATISGSDPSTTSTASTTKSTIRKEEKTSITMSIARLDGGTTENHRRNPQAASSSSTSTSQWPTSQWQTSWSSWQPTSSEKWW